MTWVTEFFELFQHGLAIYLSKHEFVETAVTLSDLFLWIENLNEIVIFLQQLYWSGPKNDIRHDQVIEVHFKAGCPNLCFSF